MVYLPIAADKYEHDRVIHKPTKAQPGGGLFGDININVILGSIPNATDYFKTASRSYDESK